MWWVTSTSIPYHFLLKGFIVCMLDLTDLIGWLDWFDMIDVIAVFVWTGWLDWYDWLRWLLGSVRLPWLCLDGIIGFIWFGCIALGLLRLDSIHRLQVDWLGQNISAQPNPTSAKQQIDTSQPSRIQSHRIQCNQPKPIQSQPINQIHAKQTNAMQPNPMNPMMPSKHSQGNRTNPSSQHNQSYRSKQPVQTSKAMTSIISNPSSQPIKSIKSSMQTINPFSKTNHMGLDWMWLITLGCLGLSWMGIACTVALIVWFWVGLFYFTRFDSVWLHYIVLDMLWVAFIWFTGVFDFTRLDFTLPDLVSNWSEMISDIDLNRLVLRESIIFNCMWICCGWLWFDSLVSLMPFD